MSKADEYQVVASRAAARAERLAMAVLTGDHSMADVAEDLVLARQERDVYQDAANLQRHRDGDRVWVWPCEAPWLGF